MIEDEEQDRQKPLSIQEIAAQDKVKPKHRRYYGVPTGVGDTGTSLGRSNRQYSRFDQDIPSGETIGPRIKNTR